MEIKRVGINDAVPGMLVAENIFNSVNQLIVPQDSLLTDKAIARMRFHSIQRFKIYVGEDAPIPTANHISDNRSYFDKLRETEEFIHYDNSFKDAVGSFEDKLKAMVSGNADTASTSLVESVRSLQGTCRNGIQIFDLLHCMRNYDDITFAHSLNVALICAVEGTWLGLSEDDIDILIQCGIYHDVGKLLIPKEITEKPSTLTSEEYKTVKTHAMQGYNLLRDKDLDNRVKLCALQHHERCDGSGYPMGFMSEQIDSFAKIVAIADIYEAMTSPRPYRKPKCPFEVIRIFEKDGLALFDPKYLMTFMENITQSYLGTKVRLNNGTVGNIIYINKLSYSRPMIQVDETNYLDLTKDTSLYIEALI